MVLAFGLMMPPGGKFGLNERGFLSVQVNADLHLVCKYLGIRKLVILATKSTTVYRTLINSVGTRTLLEKYMNRQDNS